MAVEKEVWSEIRGALMSSAKIWVEGPDDLATFWTWQLTQHQTAGAIVASESHEWKHKTTMN